MILGWLRRSFSVDLRTLALLRIATGIVVMVDLACRLPEALDHYSDLGFFPRSCLSPWSWHWNPYMCSGSLAWVYCLMALTGAGALALAAGYRSRVFGLVTLFLIYALQRRNLLAANAGDRILLLLLLYGTVLPWHRYYSWDAARLGKVSADYFGWAGAAWKIQLAAIYLFAGLAKSSPAWKQGQAVNIVLHADAYVTPAGMALAGALERTPILFWVLNHSIHCLEIGCAILLLSPWGLVQLLGAGVLMVMHLAFGLCLQLDDFSLICCVTLITFAPPLLWGGTGGQRAGVVESRVLPALMSTVIVVTLLSNCYSLISNKNSDFTQSWRMFAAPPQNGGWLVFLGVLRSGESVELYNDSSEVVVRRPACIALRYRSNRGYGFFRLGLSSHLAKAIFKAEANSLKARWEREHPQDQVDEVKIINFFQRYEPLSGYSSPQPRLLYEQRF